MNEVFYLLFSRMICSFPVEDEFDDLFSDFVIHGQRTRWRILVLPPGISPERPFHTP